MCGTDMKGNSSASNSCNCSGVKSFKALYRQSSCGEAFAGSWAVPKIFVLPPNCLTIPVDVDGRAADVDAGAGEGPTEADAGGVAAGVGVEPNNDCEFVAAAVVAADVELNNDCEFEEAAAGGAGVEPNNDGEFVEAAAAALKLKPTEGSAVEVGFVANKV